MKIKIISVVIISFVNLSGACFFVNGKRSYVSDNIQDAGLCGIDNYMPHRPILDVLTITDKNSILAYEVERIGVGSGNVVQAHAFDLKNNRMYVQTVVGKPEKGVINQFMLKASYDAGKKTAISSSIPSSYIGHQGIGVQYLANGDTRLWASAGQAIQEHGLKAVRFQYNNNYNISDIQEYQLFEKEGYQVSGSTTPAVSADGRYLIARGYVKGSHLGAQSEIRVFPINIFTDSGNYSDKYLYKWYVDPSIRSAADSKYFLQGIASDGRHVYILAGSYNVDLAKKLYSYKIDGTLIARNEKFFVGNSDARQTGKGTHYEPEGLAFEEVNGNLQLTTSISSGVPGHRKVRIYRLDYR